MTGSLESELAAFYDRDAHDRAARTIDPERVRHRDDFAELVASEGRRRVLEIGVGPGRDAAAFLARGCRVVGVDLSHEHVRLATAAGAPSMRASVLRLPVRPGSFDAVYSVSTLLHVPDDDVDHALDEMTSAAVFGAPVAIGVWGGKDWSGRAPFDDGAELVRTYFLRSHDRWRAILAEHGEIERFETWTAHDLDDWVYQWAVLRVR
jgi:SAM-dependent methyltransferase